MNEKISRDIFNESLPVVRVLYEAEQPIVYITKTQYGQEMLAYLASETRSHQFTILAPATARSISKLESGSIGVREAMIETWMWLAQETFSDRLLDVWRISAADIPEGYLPRPGTLLRPALRVECSAPVIGEPIGGGGLD